MRHRLHYNNIPSGDEWTRTLKGLLGAPTVRRRRRNEKKKFARTVILDGIYIYIYQQLHALAVPTIPTNTGRAALRRTSVCTCVSTCVCVHDPTEAHARRLVRQLGGRRRHRKTPPIDAIAVLLYTYTCIHSYTYTG